MNALTGFLLGCCVLMLFGYAVFLGIGLLLTGEWILGIAFVAMGIGVVYAATGEIGKD